MKHRHPSEVHKESLTLLDKVAVRITSRVGTMWCALAFGLLALISLPAAIHSGDTIIIIAWITQSFLQLVLLPIIMVGQNLESRHNEMRADLEYNAAVQAETNTEWIKRNFKIMNENIITLAKKNTADGLPPAPTVEISTDELRRLLKTDDEK